MTLTSTIQSTLSRYQTEILASLRRAIQQANDNTMHPEAGNLTPFYGQMQYHLGWVDTNFSPVSSNPSKLLRPTLLLLAYEAAGAGSSNAETTTHNSHHLRPALPAAAAIELTHNFTLIHDDIEDRDTERRHRPTLWHVWGIPQSINTGDGMFALARLTLWDIVNEGVDTAIAVRLGTLLDQACLVIAEGQYLDISFETRDDISVAMYVDMISHKTATLMGCAAQMGALLGTHDAETIARLRSFGYVMGIAFQVRDDILGVWASTAELGKTQAGDIYRRKKSLPALHALEHATTPDQQFLRQVYAQEAPITSAQAEEVLVIFARTHTKAYCCAFLAGQCRLAHEALANVPRNSSPIAARALNDMQALVHFVEETARE
jgi:geranylgeranyl diphosphate synthase type I